MTMNRRAQASAAASPEVVPVGDRNWLVTERGFHRSMSDAIADELVSRAKEGDAEAFGALYERFAVRLYRFMLVRVSKPEEAEDLVQRVFLKVIEALPRYQDRGIPFSAWMFRIANNTVVDFYRTVHQTSPMAALSQHHDRTWDPSDLVDAGEERATIRTALQQLTRDQRDVVVYRFFAGLSPAEIGAIMGKREGTVRVLQLRALRQLRNVGDIAALRRERAAPTSA